jgi:hypothetical protein
VVACDALCLFFVAAVVVCGEEARLHVTVSQAACRTAQHTAAGRQISSISEHRDIAWTCARADSMWWLVVEASWPHHPLGCLQGSTAHGRSIWAELLAHAMSKTADAFSNSRFKIGKPGQQDSRTARQPNHARTQFHAHSSLLDTETTPCRPPRLQ